MLAALEWLREPKVWDWRDSKRLHSNFFMEGRQGIGWGMSYCTEGSTQEPESAQKPQAAVGEGEGLCSSLEKPTQSLC